MTKRKSHLVQIIMHDTRYVAVEEHGTIRLSKDGSDIGEARWLNDQLLNLTIPLPDDVVHALEKKIKERVEANWDED